MKSSFAFILVAVVVVGLVVSADAFGVGVVDNPRACGGGCVTSVQCATWDGGNRNCRCSWFSCKRVRGGDGADAAEETRLELFEQFLSDYKNQPAMVLAAQETLQAAKMPAKVEGEENV